MIKFKEGGMQSYHTCTFSQEDLHHRGPTGTCHHNPWAYRCDQCRLSYSRHWQYMPPPARQIYSAQILCGLWGHDARGNTYLCVRVLASFGWQMSYSHKVIWGSHVVSFPLLVGVTATENAQKDREKMFDLELLKQSKFFWNPACNRLVLPLCHVVRCCGSFLFCLIFLSNGRLGGFNYHIPNHTLSPIPTARTIVWKLVLTEVCCLFGRQSRMMGVNDCILVYF